MDFKKQSLSFCQGFVLAQLKAHVKEGRPLAAETLEAYELFCGECEQIRWAGWTSASDLFDSQAKAANLEKQVEELSKSKAEDWHDLISLEWDDQANCFVFAHRQEDGEAVGIGAAYRDFGGTPMLETPPFSVAIGLPFIQAVSGALEEESDHIPAYRGSSL